MTTKVVICLKISIFVVAITTQTAHLLIQFCCDLLKNIYLCGSNNNSLLMSSNNSVVVICLKISIFVVAITTHTYLPLSFRVL